MPHTGLQPRGYFNLKEAIRASLKRLYYNIPSKIELVLSFELRDEEIRERYAKGESIPKLAVAYGLSNARIHQILHHRQR